MSLSNPPEVWAIRDAIRDLLSPRYPRTAPQIFAALTDDWGSLDERRLWRCLAWLCWRGIAVSLAPRQTYLDPEDRGYVRGYGVEYPMDAIRRRHSRLSELGLCWDCLQPFDSNKPRWMGSRCVDCYNEYQSVQRLKRYAALVESGTCLLCNGPRDSVWNTCSSCLEGLRARRAA